MKREEEIPLLQKIANHLIINSSFLNNLGLFHGKMGIVIFFYHYSRCINNPIYEEFAGELLDEIFDEIHNQLPIDFENGYLGIGWGIEYLAGQKFIDGNTNEILEDIDKKIMERDIRRISDMSLETGLEGIFHYVLSRLHTNKEINSVFDHQYFADLQSIINSMKKRLIPKSLYVLINDYIFWEQKKILNYIPIKFLKKICLSENTEKNNVYDWEMGMKGGCVGIGLSKLEI